ncbi:MAG TPA: phytanoyl-CoA dioxygenase family protein [Gammaproteobacteria bacterium]|nr:phytanoyl-CoA dioxygenase family protein [Gammaproteobacteria bacterium]
MDLNEHIEGIKTNGYSIIHDALSPLQVVDVKKALDPWLQKKLMGRNDFEGFESERVYALLAKSPIFSLLVEHPLVLAIVDHFLAPNYLLASNLAINVHPGETPQAFHADHTQIPNCPRTEINGISSIWAFDDFSEENGATEIIPGSHLLSEHAAANEDTFETVIMPAGSVIVFHGALIHRGGANNSEGTRLAITPQYCQPWLRQLENMVLAVPPDVASHLSPKVQALLGYSIRDPGFVGHVNGLHPKRLFDKHYQGRKARGIPS